MAEFLTDADFERFRQLIYNESGIHFSESNRSILESRLRERVKRAELGSVAEYYDRIHGNEGELKSLLDAVTTNLTRFFRNTAHFETFENYVIPYLVKKKEAGDKKIRLWSAGCSTGEEPYSLAMVLLDKLPKGYDFEIAGSDLSLKSLMIGMEGFYPQTRINGVPEHYLQRYFLQKGDGYQVVPEVKNRIKFYYNNLKHDPGLGSLDVVFCRNVLIYFDAPAQKAVIDRFYQVLSPDSFLFIGHSESLFGMETRFEFLRTDWAVIYRKS